MAVPDPNRKSRPFRCPAITIEDKEGICKTQRDTLCGKNAAVYQSERHHSSGRRSVQKTTNDRLASPLHLVEGENIEYHVARVQLDRRHAKFHSHAPTAPTDQGRPRWAFCARADHGACAWVDRPTRYRAVPRERLAAILTTRTREVSIDGKQRALISNGSRSSWDHTTSVRR